MTMVQEKAKVILALLPGVDCAGHGGCGYPTCQACAQAIADGAPITTCSAANNETIAAIAYVMGVEPVKVDKKVAFIKCAGHAAGKIRLKAAGVESCDKAKEKGFDKGECSYGCMGIGTCIERCKFGAMTNVDGQIVIDKEKCTGCEACLSSCVQGLIKLVPEDATNFIPCSSKNNEQESFEVCGYGCIGCGDCAIACPKEAINMVIGNKIDGRYAEIDYDKCEGCVSCTAACRRKIIVDTVHDLAEIKDTVAFVKCTGGAWGNGKLVEEGYTSCLEIEKSKVALDARDVCKYSCLGLGDCIEACRYGAISNENGVAEVDYNKCVGCGDCFRTCPRHKIEMVPYIGVKQSACESADSTERRMEVCGLGCIGCGDCAENCPNEAIEMRYGHPYIHDDKCQNCGVCTYLCTRSAIKERVVPEYNYLQRNALKLDE